MRNYATVPSTLHQSRKERVWFGFESMSSIERPPRQGVPLGRGMGKETLSQLNSLPTCFGKGYVGLPAALGVRARLPFPAVARRNLVSTCEREEGCETLSRGDEPHTIDMDTHIDNSIVPPVISSYNLYRKRGSLPQGIRALIASKKHMNQKEQAHSSKMDHCSLPASTKEQIALLDTRFLEYEHAVIGTVLTTLNAGSIVVTFFPNFAVSLSDPHVASAFKVQVQIMGANQVSASVMATLHHQLVFRLQNHSLDLPNQGSRDAPMQQHGTVKATDFWFKRLPDGRVKTIFKTQPDGEPSNPEFQLMITPIPVPKKIITPIASFGAYGHRIYTDRINGHFIWDVNPSCVIQSVLVKKMMMIVTTRMTSGQTMRVMRMMISHCNDSDDDYNEPDPDERQSFRKPQSCMMFQYETDFPPMERKEVKTLKLNWQTTHARAQNRSLTTLDAKMDRVLSRVQTTKSKVEGMENQLQKIYDNLVQKIQQLDRDLRFLLIREISEWSLIRKRQKSED
ncbi:polyprotein [Sesamum angolense]|uniref:Polyprotein n=1 Tax=Sesamum angolense TaxID=2727404 RepID=A0AAE1VYT7_9LAMI|nr:polyprotein [Sesamum angolense]